jgi:hypothetical protein
MALTLLSVSTALADARMFRDSLSAPGFTQAPLLPVQSGGNLPRQCQYVYDRMTLNDFETLLYIASYADLARTLGQDVEAGRQHFIRFGCREGREILFEPLEYIAGYDDLVGALGGNERRALEHYFKYGVRENRSIDRFCGRRYAELYPDLSRAFGRNEIRLAQHYIMHGMREGRGGANGSRFQVSC